MNVAFDRSLEDVGNLLALEHVNVQVPDQPTATTFYVTGLGLTRDPYMMTGVDNMWVNAGRNQMHLPTKEPQVLNGTIGLVIPDRPSLVRRLQAVSGRLDGTKFRFTENSDTVDVTCPWGNRFRCHVPSSAFGHMQLGIAYVEFDVKAGTAAAIARFYKEVLAARSTVEDATGSATAVVQVGVEQSLRFKETNASIAPYDGHHIQVYVCNFSAPHRRLLELGLVTEESNQHQYRFENIIDLGSGALLTTIEHEVRSLGHPLHARPLVNRNPAQSNARYTKGADAWMPNA